MFGLFKRNREPVGPFEFSHSIEIERPAVEVYALIDWADARNAKRALGNKVDKIASAPERYRMRLDLVPDHIFEMTVTDAAPGELYAFAAEIAPPVGRLASCHETYDFEPLDRGACRLRLKVAASFTGGLTDEALAMEVRMMAASCENALAKFKIQAEQGVEAVHAIEALQMDCTAG